MMRTRKSEMTPPPFINTIILSQSLSTNIFAAAVTERTCQTTKSQMQMGTNNGSHRDTIILKIFFKDSVLISYRNNHSKEFTVL